MINTKHSHSNPLYSLGKTPINVSSLLQFLKYYPNTEAAFELSEGFQKGFPLNYQGPRLPTDAKNLPSVRKAPNILQTKIDKELEAGRIAGPFSSPPLPALRVSPLGLVPKKDGDFRVIHHLSYPALSSVNDFIDESSCSVKYSSIDDAVEMVQKLGKGANLGKSDIKKAFRLLPVWPGDFDLLGFKLENKIYFDKCLPMGASISCALFEKFSTFIQWAVEHESSEKPAILHYLDDFLFGGQFGTNQCTVVMETFRSVCSLLGVPIAEEKTEGPSTQITFLGVEFDTNEMILRLPSDKLKELQAKMGFTLSRKKITLRDLQSLLGYLNFACRVIRPGRAFCRRLIDATVGIKKPHHKIRVKRSMRADLCLWQEFLLNYNGVTVMPDLLWTDNDTLELYTDSAGGVGRGFGIFFRGHWAHGKWPETWFDTSLLKNIAFLELFPVVTALVIWGHCLENKKILFHIDNQAVVSILNKKTSRDPSIMFLLRRLVLLTLTYNILLKAEHISGSVNSIADAISRCQWQKFRKLAPDADLLPSKIPEWIWEILK